MVMFHSYTTCRLKLHGLAARYPTVAEMPLSCEAFSGACAGLVQATLHSPLYNVRLCRDDEMLDNLLDESVGRLFSLKKGRGRKRIVFDFEICVQTKRHSHSPTILVSRTIGYGDSSHDMISTVGL